MKTHLYRPIKILHFLPAGRLKNVYYKNIERKESSEEQDFFIYYSCWYVPIFRLFSEQILDKHKNIYCIQNKY